MTKVKDKYIEQANVTMSDKFYGEKVSFTDLRSNLVNCIGNLTRLDEIKKSLFYGRDCLKESSGFTVSDLPYELANGGDTDNTIKLIHGVIGIATESGELLEALLKALDGQPLDVVNLKEEIGDVLWYAAAILRVSDSSFEEVQNTNIAKLKARFPDGFAEFEANNRSLI
jgi:NTP pyrophosphatase (non-canonical NTP hydrolase)